MKSSLWLVVLVSALATMSLASGCDDKKATTPKQEASDAQACTHDSDCPTDWVCLRELCSPENTARSNSVTAEKVRKKVEDIGEEADKRGQKALDL